MSNDLQEKVNALGKALYEIWESAADEGSDEVKEACCAAWNAFMDKHLFEG